MSVVPSNPRQDAAVDIVTPNLSLREGERVRTFFQGFIKIVVAISTLGASFTFSFVLGDIRSPILPLFDEDEIRLFLAMSWLLFMSTLAIACMSALVLSFLGDQAVAGFRTESKWQWGGFVMCGVLLTHLMAAFFCLCLVVMAYQLRVGFAGIFLTGAAWVGSMANATFRLVLYLRKIRRVTESHRAV
jgi:hypothetical protein